MNYFQQKYQENREHRLAYQKRYYYENRHKILPKARKIKNSNANDTEEKK